MKKIYFLIFPLLLAVLGINYGLPMHLVGDEESLVGGAIKMIELKRFFPVLNPDQFKILYYPPIIPYLYVLTSLPIIIFKFFVSGFDVLALKDYFILNLDGIWISARLTSSIFSLGVLVVVYKLTELIFSKKAAYLATILLALSFFHVLLSHQARHWIFTVFFAYLTILLTILLVKGRLKKYWLIGLTAGIALGTTYVTALGVGLAFLILFFYRHQISQPYKKIGINIFLALSIGTSLILINLPDLLRFKYGGKLVGEPLQKSFTGLLSQLEQVITILFNQEFIIFLLAVLALLLWKRNFKIKIFMASFAFLYFVVLYYFLHFEARYTYFIIPALAILAADTLVVLSEKIKYKKLYYFILSLLFLWPALGAINYTRLILADDTRELAIQYISQEIGDQEFLLSSPTIYLPRTDKSLVIAENYGHINTVERYTYNHYDRLVANFDKTYNYQNIHFWSDDFKNPIALDEYIQKYQPSYFVLEYWFEEDLKDYYSSLRQKAVLVKILRQSNLPENYDINGNFWVFNSVLFDLERLGPSIAIYKLK
ncbi:MAG: glycosyltransferase family 39 protein [Patescibacteria group bacterium]